MKKQLKVLLAFLILVLTALSVYFYREYQFSQREGMYDRLILETAARHNVPPALVKAVIRRESKFHESVRGGHGEYGLMQITPAAADDWIKFERNKEFQNYSQLLTPELNIEIGTWYLSRGLQKYKDYKHKKALALARYNAGPGNVIKNKWVPGHKDGEVLKLINFPSTKKYVEVILEFEKEYEQKGFENE